MLESNQRHDACKVLAQSPESVPSSLKIDLKALIVFSRFLQVAPAVRVGSKRRRDRFYLIIAKVNETNSF